MECSSELRFYEIKEAFKHLNVQCALGSARKQVPGCRDKTQEEYASGN